MLRPNHSHTTTRSHLRTRPLSSKSKGGEGHCFIGDAVGTGDPESLHRYPPHFGLLSYALLATLPLPSTRGTSPFPTSLHGSLRSPTISRRASQICLDSNSTSTRMKPTPTERVPTPSAFGMLLRPQIHPNLSLIPISRNSQPPRQNSQISVSTQGRQRNAEPEECRAND